jgi:hypothetical protein
MRWFSEFDTPPARQRKYHPKDKSDVQHAGNQQQIVDKKNRTPLQAAELLGLS